MDTGDYRGIRLKSKCAFASTAGRNPLSQSKQLFGRDKYEPFISASRTSGIWTHRLRRKTCTRPGAKNSGTCARRDTCSRPCPRACTRCSQVGCVTGGPEQRYGCARGTCGRKERPESAGLIRFHGKKAGPGPAFLLESLNLPGASQNHRFEWRLQSIPACNSAPGIALRPPAGQCCSACLDARPRDA